VGGVLMRWLNNVKISTKLIVGFIFIALISGIVGGVGITKIKKIDTNYSDLYVNFGVSIGDIAEVSISYQRVRINLYKMVLDKNVSNVTQYKTKIDGYNKDIQENMGQFEKSLQTDEAKAKFAELKSVLDKYNKFENDVISLILVQKYDEAFQMLSSGDGQTMADKVSDTIDSLFNLKTSIGTQRSDEYSAETNTAIVTMFIVIAIGIVCAVTFGILISRAINKSIYQLMYVTDEISSGNLNVEITNNSKDEVGILSQSMNKMQDKLHEVIGNISFASQQVNIGSKQIADSTISLSQGATEQASAVEELTASIEEISAQIKVNAENAKKANTIADATKDNAVKRNSDMKLMLKAMEEINKSSNNIAKIIKVIDEIAFQTNILALNAAVEAARAGQYGKGFTVVAEEVRNLAARSANAAKETTEIIEESLVKIKDGTDIANQTAEALDGIVVDIQDVAAIIDGISGASTEQATGMTQISQGVVQISQVVQSNSATAEECAAASEELAGQAEVLKEQVETFRLGSIDEQRPKYNSDRLDKQKKNKNEINSLKDRNVKKENSKKIILSDTEFGKY
jgi:methyl-accepting chemotaxis protein